MAKKEVEYCSFCGRAEPETEMLIRGMAGNICNYCVEQANIINLSRLRIFLTSM